ncbi:MAG TPA: alpha/beta fold hydrolase [Thermoanaerobaculia bacterium]|nr:alpha/beta fold hydrolase [Thermoanaerobaculia bacterium]
MAPVVEPFSISIPPEAIDDLRARLRAALMSRLGYERFAVQGGDWGAGIATWLAWKFPTRIAGIHLNYIPGSYTPFVEGEMTPEEEAFLRDRDEWLDQSYAYGMV